jgi:hypothetical protein
MGLPSLETIGTAPLGRRRVPATYQPHRHRTLKRRHYRTTIGTRPASQLREIRGCQAWGQTNSSTGAEAEGNQRACLLCPKPTHKSLARTRWNLPTFAGAEVQNTMRTFRAPKQRFKRKLTAEQEAQYRSNLIERVRRSHGYSAEYLGKQTTRHLAELARRIGSEHGLKKIGRLSPDRHAAKVWS